MELLLQKLIEGVSNTRGHDFFQRIVQLLNMVIGADYTFIARLDEKNYSANTIALVAKGKLVDNISYSLEHTPCANVSDDSFCCYPKDVCAAYPKDELLVQMGVEGYLGTPLHDLTGRVIGIIVALYQQPISDPLLVKNLFELFSGRIEAELERVEYEDRLQALNTQLEQKVAARTAQLQQTLADLQLMQRQLVESEKMAALGHLVAGIAHEVNTPLGVAITTHSVMADEFSHFAALVSADRLTKTELRNFCQVLAQALPLLQANLNRADELIQNFKRTAADQHSAELGQINLAHYYQQIISTLSPVLKKAGVQLQMEIPPDWQIQTYPGSHVHILTNLVVNSEQHGFGAGEGHQIWLSAEQLADDLYCIHYRDNGCGLTQIAKQHIFEPFFTTARNHGGVGLGMSILYNLVTQQLGGQVQLPDGQGFCLSYSFRHIEQPQ